MKRTKSPIITIDKKPFTDSQGRSISDNNGNVIQFADVVAQGVYPYEVTVPVSSFSLTIPPRRIFSTSVSVTTAYFLNWKDSSGNQIKDSEGNDLIFNAATAVNAKPPILTIPASNSALVVED